MIKTSKVNGIEIIECFPDTKFTELDKKMIAQNVSTMLEVYEKSKNDINNNTLSLKVS